LEPLFCFGKKKQKYSKANVSCIAGKPVFEQCVSGRYAELIFITLYANKILPSHFSDFSEENSYFGEKMNE